MVTLLSEPGSPILLSFLQYNFEKHLTPSSLQFTKIDSINFDINLTETLPIQIITKISTYLNQHDKLNLMLCNHYIHDLVKPLLYERVWIDLIHPDADLLTPMNPINNLNLSCNYSVVRDFDKFMEPINLNKMYLKELSIDVPYHQYEIESWLPTLLSNDNNLTKLKLRSDLPLDKLQTISTNNFKSLQMPNLINSILELLNDEQLTKLSYFDELDLHLKNLNLPLFMAWIQDKKLSRLRFLSITDVGNNNISTQQRTKFVSCLDRHRLERISLCVEYNNINNYQLLITPCLRNLNLDIRHTSNSSMQSMLNAISIFFKDNDFQHLTDLTLAFESCSVNLNHDEALTLPTLTNIPICSLLQTINESCPSLINLNLTNFILSLTRCNTRLLPLFFANCHCDSCLQFNAHIERLESYNGVMRSDFLRDELIAQLPIFELDFLSLIKFKEKSSLDCDGVMFVNHNLRSVVVVLLEMFCRNHNNLKLLNLGGWLVIVRKLFDIGDGFYKYGIHYEGVYM